MKSAKQLFEDKFEQLNQAIKQQDYSDAPFGFDHNECVIWVNAQQNMLQWVLEMM